MRKCTFAKTGNAVTVSGVDGMGGAARAHARFGGVGYALPLDDRLFIEKLYFQRGR